MDLVKQLRVSKGWSQEHLAATSGVGRATIQRIESGRVVPSRETAQSLAAALDADAERIREGAGLSRQVSRLMSITNSRDATAAEMVGLPRPIRTVFEKFYAARRELEESGAAFKLATEEWSAAFQERSAVSDERHRLMLFSLTAEATADLEAITATLAAIRAISDRFDPLNTRVELLWGRRDDPDR